MKTIKISSIPTTRHCEYGEPGETPAGAHTVIHLVLLVTHYFVKIAFSSDCENLDHLLLSPPFSLPFSLRMYRTSSLCDQNTFLTDATFPLTS